MTAFVPAFSIATLVLGLVVGFGLLRVWYRSRQLAELTLGVAATCRVLSVALLWAATTLPGLVSSTAGGAMWCVGVVLLATGPSAILVGLWRIFRPDDFWARILVFAGVSTLVGWACLRLYGQDRLLQTTDMNIAMLFHSVTTLTQIWLLVETTRYSVMCRKRAALGLGNPMTAHRFWLWSVSAASGLVRVAIYLAVPLVFDVSLVESPLGFGAVSLLGLVSITCLALAFFPPATYRSWVEGRALTAPG